jgi:hypothetical protein
MFRDAPQLTRSKVGLRAVLTLACASIAYAQSGDTDWRLYGGADLGKDGGEQKLFFDAAGIIRRGDGHIEVWTKALPQKALDRADKPGSATQKKIVDSAVHKMMTGYVPPSLIVLGLEKDQNALTNVMAEEAAANVGSIGPSTQILYELDCTNRLMRELSIHVNINGKLEIRETPREWSHTPPETAGATLLKILCRQQG